MGGFPLKNQHWLSRCLTCYAGVPRRLHEFLRRHFEATERTAAAAGIASGRVKDCWVGLFSMASFGALMLGLCANCNCDMVVTHSKWVFFFGRKQETNNMEVWWEDRQSQLSDSCEVNMEPANCTELEANCDGPWQLCGRTVWVYWLVLVVTTLLHLLKYHKNSQMGFWPVTVSWSHTVCRWTKPSNPSIKGLNLDIFRPIEYQADFIEAETMITRHIFRAQYIQISTLIQSAQP